MLDKIEPHKHTVPHGDRGGVPIEPRLTEQWYVDAATLAKPAIASVREGRTNFVPKNWEKTYFEWMENIQPWCVSRQLWWGHQIPAWYGPDGQVFVEKTEEEALHAAIQHYLAHEGPMKAYVEDLLENFRPGEILTRDEDVLDTWFSSALWPFSTLGWPDKTPELERYYQTDVLVTGFDIIFFWVARMMMMGLHFMKDERRHADRAVPYRLRACAGSRQERPEDVEVEGQRHRSARPDRRIWCRRAAFHAGDHGGAGPRRETRSGAHRRLSQFRHQALERHAFCRDERRQAQIRPSCRKPASLTINRWILTELSRTIRDVTEAIEGYRFNEAASSLYRFVWNQFCDWYLELLKPVFGGEDEVAKAESQACVAYVLDETYKLLHPFMPFMTEELWAQTAGEGNARDGLLCHAEWPAASFADDLAANEINWLIDLVSGIRSVRAEMNVPPGAMAPLVVVGANVLTRERLERHDSAIRRLARIETIALDDAAPKGSAQVIVGEATACLPLGSLIDLGAERSRLEKSVGKIEAERARILGKLANEKFVANAKPEVVDAERERLAELDVQKASVEVALARLADAG